MFYLKYRPGTIAQLDNINPRNTLLGILSSSTVPHAFLLVGQKGTGKTSAARIIAKSLNCLHEQKKSTNNAGIEPCNTCSSCTSINSSSFPDVLELDAASNRGINEIKALMKETAFLPFIGKYRIFIIDEAHMITTDGFNALLKTLEEPPETVIFILATTELQKVPKTIVSRCVQINFGRAKKEEVVHMLQRITAGEKLVVSKELLQLIADHSDFSFRDAAKLLEELVMLKKLDFKDAQNYIGIRANQNLLHMLDSDMKSVKSVLQFIQKFSESGGSIKILIEELLGELHQELLIKTEAVSEGKAQFALSLSQIILLMKLLQEAYSNLKYSPIESLPLEIAIVEFHNKRFDK